jgi:hypothetical protein
MFFVRCGPFKTALVDQIVTVDEKNGFLAQPSGSKNIVKIWIKKTAYSVVFGKS